MNKDNAKQYLPLVRALADGHAIQYRAKLGWRNVDNPSFLETADKYRIKRKPLTRYAIMSSEKLDGWDHNSSSLTVFTSLDDAKAYINNYYDKGTTAKVVKFVQADDDE